METLRRRAGEFHGGRSGLMHRMLSVLKSRLRRLFRADEMAAPLIAVVSVVLLLLSASCADAAEPSDNAANSRGHVCRGTTRTQDDRAGSSTGAVLHVSFRAR